MLDPAGAIIAFATVDLYSEMHEWHTTTDTAGKFSFSALRSGIYDMEVTSAGFRKKIIQSVRIDSSEPAPVTITLQVANYSCGDSFAKVTYMDTGGESGIRGVVTLESHPGVTEKEGKKRSESAVGLLSGATISVLRWGSNGKPLKVRPNENGEFDFALEPGLYSLRASDEGYDDFVVSNVRVRPGKALDVRFSMRPSSYIVLCQ